MILSWQTKLIIFLAALAISFTAGWRVHSWKTDAAAVGAVETVIQANTKLNKESGAIVEKMQAEEQQVRIVYRTIHERIDNAPSDRVCFSPESLSMWNDAIAGADSHRQKPAGAAGGTGAAEASEKDILRNGTTNFEKCKRNNILHNALIDKVESLEGKMCVCQE
jgi:hypothetical protein